MSRDSNLVRHQDKSYMKKLRCTYIVLSPKPTPIKPTLVRILKLRDDAPDSWMHVPPEDSDFEIVHVRVYRLLGASMKAH